MKKTVVISFSLYAGSPLHKVTKYCVKAMEQGLLHVDAVNKSGHTFGFVLVDSWLFFVWKYWYRYWALKPSVQKFWTLLLTAEFDHRIVLHRCVDIPALWEDLFALYQLANAEEEKTAWLRQEVERRVSASLRFAWIAAVV